MCRSATLSYMLFWVFFVTPFLCGAVCLCMLACMMFYKDPVLFLFAFGVPIILLIIIDTFLNIVIVIDNKISMKKLNKSWQSFAGQFGLEFNEARVTMICKARSKGPNISGFYRNHNIWLSSRSYSDTPETITVDMRAINYDGSIWGYDDSPTYNSSLYIDLNNMENLPIDEGKLKRIFDEHVQSKLVDLKNPKTWNVDGKGINIHWLQFLRDKSELQLIIDTIINIAEDVEKRRVPHLT